MKALKCDKCGKTQDMAQDVEDLGWGCIRTLEGWVDLCPKCYKMYKELEQALHNEKEETLARFLNTIVS